MILRLIWMLHLLHCKRVFASFSLSHIVLVVHWFRKIVFDHRKKISERFLFLLKVNEFPDFLSGEERDCCQHVFIQHLAESVKVKVKVILFRRVYVWSLRVQINVITARKRNLRTSDLGTILPLPVLTSSGGHRNTYVWQAGGMHLTGMVSCYLCEFVKNSIFLFTILE